MKRRNFLSYSGLGIAYLGMGMPHFQKMANHPVLLSEKGCGRATAYSEANKIITFEKKTHVTWLDSEDENFFVRIKTFNRSNNRWSEVYEVGEGFDNHGGAALTVDSRGYLHIVYYPHHHPMRYRRSVRPNDASAWEPEMSFGERCTYPTLVCGPDNTLYLSCRQSRDDQFLAGTLVDP